ncbi:MAG: HINT domain-containing protein [Saprospiraceae bacterium]|nr:HINT domain-containing protein [Saprospiraceae bacterium]
MISYKKQQEQQDKTKGLYNGNIAWMMTQIPELERQIGTNHDLVASVYQYDQLQRIIQSRTYHNPNGNWAYDGNFNTDYSFDANGNLKTLKRRAKGTQIDNFTYNYNYQGVDLINNQLTHIDDATFVSLSGINDLGDQAPNNYLYNAEGSLIKDAQEGINNITWTFQDKIQQIDKGNGVTFDYTYDPAGNRLSKDIDGDQTIYVRDASGELLAVYENTSGQWIQTEITLYGAKRLGTLHRNVVASNVTDTENSYIYDRGFKQYELANHLGNVLVSVSDKKRGIDQNLGGGTDGIVDKYLANVSQASNCYPFGWHMPDHNYSSTENRFGFQAQEEDPELWEGATNYKYRMHNPRTGRFFSVDPLDAKYPHNSSYAFSENSLIAYVELEGAEKLSYIQKNKYYSVSTDSYLQNGLNGVANVWIWATNSTTDAVNGAVSIWNGAVDLVTDPEGTIGSMPSIHDVIQGAGEGMNEIEHMTWGEFGDEFFKIENFESLGGNIITGGGIFKSASGFRGGNGLPNTKSKSPKPKSKSTKICGGCFTAETLIKTKEGDKNIEDIKVGDWVWARNDTNGIQEYKEVLSLKVTNHDEIYKIYTSNDTIKATYEHPFYSKGKWVEAENLNVGDTLELLNNSKVVIIHIERELGNYQVYNFTVEDFHTYFVGNDGILVHNSSPCIEDGLKNIANSPHKRHISDHFLAGNFYTSAKSRSETFKQGYTQESVASKALDIIQNDPSKIISRGKSPRGHTEYILDFGQPVNMTGSTQKVRIWMNPTSGNISSMHPKTQ